jgi:uncharacterized protein
MSTDINQLVHSHESSALEVQREFMQKVYGWMLGGLLITAFVSFMVLNSFTVLEFVFSNNFIFYGLMFGELGLVWYLSARIESLQPRTAMALFVLYSALNGITLTSLALVYTGSSLMNMFLVTGGMFGAMSVFGTVTKRDLSGWGSFLMMGLIGIMIAAVLNIFLGSDMIVFVTSIIGVIVFTGLTAYETQGLRELALNLQDNQEGASKAAIIGALSLYLNFINLFISLLRLFGDRR